MWIVLDVRSHTCEMTLQSSAETYFVKISAGLSLVCILMMRK